MGDAALAGGHRGGDQLHQKAAEFHQGQLFLLLRRAGGGPQMQRTADPLIKGDAPVHVRRVDGDVAKTLIMFFQHNDTS